MQRVIKSGWNEEDGHYIVLSQEYYDSLPKPMLIYAVLDKHTADVCRDMDGRVATTETMPPHKVPNGDTPCHCIARSE